MVPSGQNFLHTNIIFKYIYLIYCILSMGREHNPQPRSKSFIETPKATCIGRFSQSAGEMNLMFKNWEHIDPKFFAHVCARC